MGERPASRGGGCHVEFKICWRPSLPCMRWFVSIFGFGLRVESTSHFVRPKRSSNKCRRVDTFELLRRRIGFLCLHELRKKTQTFCKLRTASTGSFIVKRHNVEHHRGSTVGLQFTHREPSSRACLCYPRSSGSISLSHLTDVK
jgi:hypothetical protein